MKPYLAIAPEMSAPIRERLLALIDMSAGPDKCWLWRGCLCRRGYGVISWKNRQYKAHRLSLEILGGREVPTHLMVCHHCDNPPCVNPAHLFLGTSMDNIRDMEAKGRLVKNLGDRNGARTRPDRVARGDRNGARVHPERLSRGESRSKVLTDELVRTILQSTTSSASIARELGIARSQIVNIRQGRAWKHIARPSCES